MTEEWYALQNLVAGAAEVLVHLWAIVWGAPLVLIILYIAVRMSR